MAGLLDIASIIGGVLLCLSLITLGILLIRRKERQRGFIFLLAGLALAIIITKTFLFSY